MRTGQLRGELTVCVESLKWTEILASLQVDDSLAGKRVSVATPAVSVLSVRTGFPGRDSVTGTFESGFPAASTTTTVPKPKPCPGNEQLGCS